MAYSSPLSSVAFSLLLILVAFCLAAPNSAVVRGFSIREAMVHDLQLAFKQYQLSSRGLVKFYIGEIRRLNPVLHGVIEINPDALLQADKADREREAKKPGSLCGLHGIPVLLKDNIGTKDKLNTTAGSFALLGSIVPRDAGVVKRLRMAGAIILGKASLSEWADFRSLTAPAGLSARGGQGKNPYVLSASPCGSSSGPSISIAANIAAVSIGTETDGSILCPASFNSVVGIKPTVGLTSRAGVIPVSLKELVASPVRSLADIIAFDNANPDKELLNVFGQEIFLAADATNGIGNVEKAALLNLAQLTEDGFEKLVKEKRLDAVVTAGPGIAPVLAIGGFPGINVPAGYDGGGVPFGINFGGLKGSEAKLIEIAYRFEQATLIRKPPSFKF